ncbi:pirin family protein [Dyadobacter sp. LHD-138]|uniref:pirin family protein n=1 Tax=Dyadobacter sp. LHD-138 TaxID=3071413 RepID=UPI0027E06BD9|nr:pirin family protein [Dyadobacter sp. LHD-138]MDQ6480307.1 pirin family protein [Dyadobacter sp. LHD-138]
MITQTEGQIYLAGQRGLSQLSMFRSFHTFNFGLYQDENRAPFGNLQVFNDDTLAGGKSLGMQVGHNTEVILLPVVGALEYRNSLGKTGILEAGQFQVFAAAKGMEYEITNPYEEDLVNFIQIWLKNDEPVFEASMQEKSIDLETRNQLLPLFSPYVEDVTIQQQAYAFIGKFEGRQEAVYPLKNPDNGIFVFIIEGAFEVQNRLMEARDGLSLRNLEELEFEALSNDAIILIMEFTAPD